MARSGEHDEVLALCRVVLREGSKSFAQAACLFDRDTRAAARLLYAWCRHCDDQIDGETLGYKIGAPDGEGRESRLATLVETTRAALRGDEQTEPVFVALQRVVGRYAIPDRYPLELLDGFAMDLEGRRYPEMGDLFLYCYHVAGTVGLMMAHVMGVRDAATLRRAADLGIALQMTNIARDVVDDARSGRVYLPLAWLAEAGVPADEVAEERHRRGVARVVGRLLSEADRYYQSGAHGLCHLPFRSAWAVAVARGVYREIGEAVRRRGEHAWDERVIVPRSRKLLEVGRGFLVACFTSSVGRLVRRAPREDLWTKEPSLD
jgi:15-cis-phytoene synthase